MRPIPSFQATSGRNRDLYGAVWRIHGRDSKHSNCLILLSVAICPRVCPYCFRVSDQIENFDRPFPRSLTLKNFFDRYGFDVKRFATMRHSDGILSFVIFLCGIHQIRHLPRAVFNPCFHCGRATERAVDFHQVVVREVENDCRFEIVQEEVSFVVNK
jgi:hypothetical protein